MILPTVPHEYRYESDESGHWPVCSCGDTTEKEEHYFDWTLVAENDVNPKAGICSVCGYETEADVSVDEALPKTGRKPSPSKKPRFL